MLVYFASLVTYVFSENAIEANQNQNPFISVRTADYSLLHKTSSLFIVITNHSDNTLYIDEISFRSYSLARMGWSPLTRRSTFEHYGISIPPNGSHRITIPNYRLGEIRPSRRHRVVFWIDGYIFSVQYDTATWQRN